jgi:hypothetical protein
MIETPLNARSDETESRESPVQNPVLRTGLYTGALLIIAMLGALVAANRVPGLERYAFERNAACAALFILLMLIPVVRFLNRPLRMFGAAMIAWVMLVCAYDLSGLFFKDLFDVLRTPLQALVEGTIVYGLFAVGSWVCAMLLHARRHPITPGRIKAAREAARHSR